jgi:hypothetical protein
MEKHFCKPIIFTLNSKCGMVNVYYALELKFFMYKLLNSESN